MLKNQICLTIWKSYVYRKRNPILTLIEIFLLIFFCFTILLLRHNHNKFTKVLPSNGQITNSFNEDDCYFTVLFVFPKNITVTNFLTNFSEKENIGSYIAFQNVTSLTKYVEQIKTINKDTFVVKFDSHLDNDVKQFNYSIQSLNDVKLANKYLSTSSVFKSVYESLDKNLYTLRCMVTLQKILDDSLLQVITKDFKHSIKIQSIQLPESFKKYANKHDPIFNAILYPIIIGFMTTGMTLAVSLSITSDRESGITELSKLMGQNFFAHFIGLAAHVFILTSIVTTIIVASFKTHTFLPSLKPIIQETPISTSLFTLVIFLYVLSTIALYILIMALIKNQHIAIIVAIISSQLTFPYSNDAKISDMLLRLLPSSHLAMCFKIINSVASIGKELDFSQVNNILFIDSKVCAPLLNVIISLCALSAFYIIATWYIYSIQPGKFGVGKKWYFPITDLITTYTKIKEVSTNRLNQSGILVTKLHKMYDPNKYALFNIYLLIAKNQITALLGPNGAGKSTMMKIITGLISPTIGTVTINGYDISNHLQAARKQMGLCPQDNIHSPYLTVKEHLVFFSIGAKQEAENCIKLLNLTEKANTLPGKLSGGMKRKLSLGIAIMGESNTLILDEPSSGLDPQSRRELWNILMKLKKGRTILLSTHFMEDAEEIADRVIIMQNGEIINDGSVNHLKMIYGNLNRLTITMHDNQKDLIVETVRKWIPKATLVETHKTSIVFQFPTNKSVKYASLFKELELLLQANHYNANIDLSSPSLEDVFLKNVSNSTKNHCPINSKEYVASNKGINYRKLKNFELHLAHFRVLLYKRYLYTLRNWKTFAFSILLIFTSLIFLMTTSFNNTLITANNNLESVTLNQNLYEPNKELIYVQYIDEQGINLQNIIKILNQTVNYKLIRVKKDIEKKLTEFTENNFDKFTKHVITAFKLNYNNVTKNLSVICLTNQFATYANNIGVNRITNTLLKFLTNDQNRSINVDVASGNNYIQFSTISRLAAEFYRVPHWIMLMLSILLLITYYCTFPVQESSLRHLQYVFGITPIKYWVSNFVFDYVIYAAIIGTVITSISIWSKTNDIPVNELVFKPDEITFNLMEFGATGIIFMYLISIIFNSHLKAYTISLLIIGVSVFTGVIIQLIPTTHADFLKLFVFVQYGAFIVKLSLNMLIQKNEPSPIHVFLKGTELSLRETTYVLLINSFTFVIFIVLIETKIFEQIVSFFQKRKVLSKKDNGTTLDSDVEEEQARVESKQKHVRKPNSTMLIKHLTKIFGNFWAVKNVSFKVDSGQCFVLLGTNGAGKSTMFRMLSNDLIPTDGDALIGNHSLKRHLRSYLLKLGYCAQTDLLPDYCTGRETLRMFAMIKGVNNVDIDSVVKVWLHRLDLTPYADQVTAYYSGGTKRRMCAAIAMIGNPPFVLLDEPTTGIDPLYKHQFWLSLNLAKDWGQSILLTSHSLNECEALCDRLAIMRNGQLACIGTLDYLKQKFWKGFNITVLFYKCCTHVQKDIFHVAMSKHFSDCWIISEYKDTVHYQTGSKTKKWSEVFEIMEKLQFENKRIILDYSVKKTTLEQLFLSFTKQEN